MKVYNGLNRDKFIYGEIMAMKLLLIFTFFITTNSMAAKPHSDNSKKTSCSKEMKDQFRLLYIELQKKLNYGGKDAEVVNGKVVTKAHAPEEVYGGQVFEQALYHEYQNSLKKVAKLFLTDKTNSTLDTNPQYPQVVEFFKMIESGTENAVNLANIKIEDLLAQIKKQGTEKFTTPADKKYILNANDIYLLKKLMIHAYDYTVRVENYEQRLAKQNNKPKKGDKKAEEIRQKPLQRMLKALREGKITDKTNLDIADDLTANAINDAINTQMDNLKRWLNDNSACKDYIRNNPGFIQAHIQPSNFKKFIDALDCKNDAALGTLGDHDIHNMEALLQFISANQRHKNVEPKAETGFNDQEFERFTNATFNPPDVVAVDECTKTPDTQTCCSKKKDPTDLTKTFEWSENQCKLKVAAEDCTKTPDTQTCCSKKKDPTDLTKIFEWSENQCKVKAVAEDCTKTPDTQTCCSKKKDPTDLTKIFEWSDKQCKLKVVQADECIKNPDTQDCCNKKNVTWITEHPEAPRTTKTYEFKENKCVPITPKKEDSTATPDQPDAPAEIPTVRGLFVPGQQILMPTQMEGVYNAYH
jgi:hypothetical protein